MPNDVTMVTLNDAAFQSVLSLRRTPRFLRFTKSTTKDRVTWDALDQFDDLPRPTEQIVVGVLGQRGSLHIDSRQNGRKVAQWYRSAHYDPVAEQPSDDTVRSTALWRAWCLANAEPVDF